MFLEWFGRKRHPREVDEVVIDDYIRHCRKAAGQLRRDGRPEALAHPHDPEEGPQAEADHRYRRDAPVRREQGGSLNWLNFGQADPVLGHLHHLGRADLYDLVIFLIDTGARITEALTLRWRTVRAAVVVFENRKNGGMAGVPLTKRAQAALQRRRSAATHPDGPFMDISDDQARRQLGAIYRKLGGDYATITQPFHVFRHSCASRLAVRGVDALRIKEWMDHASMTTTMLYMKLAPSGVGGGGSSIGT